MRSQQRPRHKTTGVASNVVHRKRQSLEVSHGSHGGEHLSWRRAVAQSIGRVSGRLEEREWVI